MGFDTKEGEGKPDCQPAGRKEQAGITASMVAFGVIKFEVPAISARQSGPAILPTPLAACASPTPRALSRTGTPGHHVSSYY